MQPEFIERSLTPDQENRRDTEVYTQELDELDAAMRSVLWKRNVLEIAFGNGHWTARLRTAANPIPRLTVRTPLQLTKLTPPSSTWYPGNAPGTYDFASVAGDCDAGMANFWLAHVHPAHRRSFLDAFHHRIGYGASVFMADYVSTDGIGGERTSTSCAPYFFEDHLLGLFEPYTRELHLHIGSTFWYVYYEAAPCSGKLHS